MPGTVIGNNNQVIINLTDSIPPDNIATIDKSGMVGNTYTKTQFDQSFSTKANEIDTKIENIQQMVESDFKGTLNPSDVAPTADGSYKPEVSSTDNISTDPNNYGTLYSNAGGLRAKEGYDTMFYKKGTVWKKSESKLPNTALQTFNPGDNVNPSVMKATADRYDPALTVLKTFITAPGDVVKKEYKWADTIQSIYGVSPQSGLLRNNNTFEAYSEAGAEFRTWMNVPVSDFDYIDLSFVRIGGSGYYVSLIGKKADGSTNVLIGPNSDPATKLLENIKMSVANYVSVSFTLINFTSNDTGLNSDFKFIEKGGLLEEDAVKKFIESNTAGMYFGLIDVDKEGAKGDGITDDTNVINSCVNKLIAQGGGNILFHARTYIVSQINIPNVTDWLTIGFLGAFIPAQRFGTITARPQYPPEFSKPNGTVIKGYSNSVNAVIFGQPGTSYQNFNTAFLSLENLTVRTSVENPNVNGVDAGNLFQLMCKNVNIDTGVYNVDAIEPTHDKSGLVTPKNQNCARTVLQGISISGFYHGIRVFEHTNGDDLQIQSCKNALTFETADHASYFKRVCLQRNTNQINVIGEHRFEIAQLDMEYAGVGQTTPENVWQSTEYELKDPNNLGIGRITYANVKGGLGKISTWRALGGSKIIANEIGTDNKVFLTQSQYNALSTAEKNNGKEYFIQA